MNEDENYYEKNEVSKPFPNDYEEAERDYAELDNLTELFGEDDIISYEVECPYCKTVFEVNIEEPFEIDCPECHKLVSSDFIK